MALLRSLAVIDEIRSMGYGKALVTHVENYAIRNNINEVYLLTQTAEAFFIKLGYKIIPKEDAPESIKNTTEFKTLCPDNATLMFKSLKD